MPAHGGLIGYNWLMFLLAIPYSTNQINNNNYKELAIPYTTNENNNNNVPGIVVVVLVRGIRNGK
jgi:hypothetical protein